MNKLSQNWNKLSSAAAVAMASVSTGAFAVSDLPGGPSVRQLNLHLPATKLAEDVCVFALVHDGHLRGHLCGRVWCHVLFHLQTPQIARPQGSSFPRVNQS